VRVKKTFYHLRYTSAWLGKPFDEAGKDDIIALVGKVEQSDLGERTKQDFRKFIKQLYRWLRNTDGSPPEVKWIKVGDLVPNGIMKKDLLTPAEVDSIIEAGADIQDKALFSVLFGSRRRLGEILSLRICDVEFDSLGAKLGVDGKVGKDIVRICALSPRLAMWLDNHPDQENPKAPLWITPNRLEVRRFAYQGARTRLKRAVKKAGIKKKSLVLPFQALENHAGFHQAHLFRTVPRIRLEAGIGHASVLCPSCRGGPR